MPDRYQITALHKGEKGRVISVEASSGNHLRKLAAFGILPGIEVEVLQTSPAYVLQVNNTQLALDYEIASNIFVEK